MTAGMTTGSKASEAARKSALIVVPDTLGCLCASGPERRDWLQRIVTADLSRVEPQRGAQSLLLTKQGKILTELSIVESGQALYLGTSAGVASEIHRYLLEYLIMEDAELDDLSHELGWIFLHGPRSEKLAPRALERGALAWGVIDVTGLGGAAVVARRSELESLAGELVESESGVLFASPADWHELRLERGLGEFGVDYTNRDNPHEASLEKRAVSFDKGCYLGQEVVCMQDMRGKVKRRIATLLLDTDVPPAVGTPVHAESAGIQAVGEVTSAARSSRLGKVLVMARLKTPYFEPGAVVKVADHTATVIEQPL
jgi:hypothetical protein